MGATIVTSFMLSTATVAWFLMLPHDAHLTSNQVSVLMFAGVVWMISFVSLILWTDHVRAFYAYKTGTWATFVKIITFPIWLLGMILMAIGIIHEAERVRDWMQK